MKKSIKILSNLFCGSNYSSKFAIIGLILSLIPASGVIGELPYSEYESYGMYIVIAMAAIIYGRRINSSLVLILFAGTLSIIIGNPPTFFRSWERFLLWATLFVALVPIFDSSILATLRSKLFDYTLLICCFIGCSSLFCYFFGINYMNLTYNYITVDDIDKFGRFSGLMRHSMILGPVSAIASICFLWLYVFKSKIRKYKIICALGFILSLCSTLLSASRGAVVAGCLGCLSMIFAHYRKNFSQLSKRIILFVIAIIALYPIYSPYLEKTIMKQEMNVRYGGTTFMSRSVLWEHRIKEFQKKPLFGVGFASVDPTIEHKYNKKSGIIEPGSSWLGIASMTGLFGLFIILYNFIATSLKIYRLAPISREATLLIGLLIFFALHLAVEGYIFAGGNYMCFIFWLIFGIAYTFTTIHCQVTSRILK